MKENNKKRITAKAHKRHVRVYKILRALLSKPASLILGCKAEKAPEIEGNYLVLSNHNTDFDFFFTGMSFPRHMYFVASEHIYQLGFASSLLRYFLAPISRVKGKTAASTVMNIMRSLKSGDNVLIFAEGNRSFNGETCPILFSTGKLARSCGVSLITYRINRAYLASPRWSKTYRRGKITSGIVNIYSPEQLKSMTDEEINEVIKKDLYENAYAAQEKEMIPFKGKRLAEGLEHILHICPQCGGVSTISSSKNKISCSCGMEAEYDKYGFLNGAPYRTVLEWDKWQQQKLPEIIAAAEENIFFSDNNVSMFKIADDHKPTLISTGTLSFDRNNLYLDKHTFPINELSGLAIYSKCTIVFTHDDTHYELKMDKKNNACAVKYVRAYNLLTSGEHYTI